MPGYRVALRLYLPIVLTTATALLAIQHPALTGTWTLDGDKTQAVGGGTGNRENAGGGRGGGLGLGVPAESLTIAQTKDRLIVDERRGTTTSRIVYRLDAGGVENVVAAGRNAGTKATYRSRWQGSRLVTTIDLGSSPAGVTLRYEEQRWLEPDGTMVIETRRPGEPNLRRIVYRRAK
jgi:hypothetical protein